MGLSDCPDCWETPCICSRQYLGSKNYAYGRQQKVLNACEKQLKNALEQVKIVEHGQCSEVLIKVCKSVLKKIQKLGD